MTKKETLQLITILASNYQTLNSQLKDEMQLQIIINTWTQCLSDLDYKVVIGAVKSIIEKNKFQPTIAEIREEVKHFTYMQDLMRVRPDLFETDCKRYLAD